MTNSFVLPMNGNVPCEFTCPITQEIMKDPVVLADGHSYERNSIQRWLIKSDKSPMTNVWLKDKTMRPNIALKNLIQDY